MNKITKALRGSSKGVSLIEVLIALAILGVIAVAFLGGLSTSLKAVFVSDERSTAQSLATSQMEYVKSQEYSTVVGWSYTVTTSGSSSSDAPLPWFDSSHALPDAYAGYCVKVEAGQIDSEEGIRKITVTVYHNEDCIENEVLTLQDYKVNR